MTEPKRTRRELLEQFVTQKPDDAFSRYGLALEYMNGGDATNADVQFRELLQRNSEYVPGYLMYAQLLVKESRQEEAKSVLTRGVEMAIRKGDGHARSEMEGLLTELG